MVGPRAVPSYAHLFMLSSQRLIAQSKMQVLQETDIIAEGRIKARNAPNAPKKEEESKDESAEAPGDTVAPPAEGAAAEAAPAPAAEAPKAEPAAAEGVVPTVCSSNGGSRYRRS